ncbi:MAG: recombinase family protein [bacterium]
MKCVIYVRVSDQSQVDGTSLDTQEKQCREYAGREGFTVAKVFREEGVSAKTLNRPEFQKLLEYVGDSKIKAIVVYKVDRLSRNLENQLFAIRTLQEAGVGLRSATENVDDTPAGKLQRNMLGAFAEYDNLIRGERCRNGLVARFSEGYWVSTPPPGYDMVRGRDKRSRAVLNEMSPIIKWAFEKRADGWTFKRIANGMNSRGYRSRQGRKLREQNVHHVIKNSFYMGLMKSYGMEIWGNHKPLVNKDLWYRCQAINEQNAHSSPTRSIINPLFPLRGLIHCSLCGERLTASSPRSRNGERHPYYHHRYPSKCPLAKNTKKDNMETDFKGKLKELKPKLSMFPIMKEILLERWQERLKDYRKDQKVVSRELDNLQQEKANLLTEKRRNPHLYTDEDFIAQVKELKGKIKALELLQSEHQSEQDDFEQIVTIAFEALKNPLRSWEDLKDVSKKVRFEHFLYPAGIEYDGKSLSNHQISLLMQIFTSVSAKREKVEAAIISRSSG